MAIQDLTLKVALQPGGPKALAGLALLLAVAIEASLATHFPELPSKVRASPLRFLQSGKFPDLSSGRAGEGSFAAYRRICYPQVSSNLAKGDALSWRMIVKLKVLHGFWRG
jgi:hypothetical protein